MVTHSPRCHPRKSPCSVHLLLTSLEGLPLSSVSSCPPPKSLVSDSPRKSWRSLPANQHLVSYLNFKSMWGTILPISQVKKLRLRGVAMWTRSDKSCIFRLPSVPCQNRAGQGELAFVLHPVSSSGHRQHRRALNLCIDTQLRPNPLRTRLPLSHFQLWGTPIGCTFALRTDPGKRFLQILEKDSGPKAGDFQGVGRLEHDLKGNGTGSGGAQKLPHLVREQGVVGGRPVWSL